MDTAELAENGWEVYGWRQSLDEAAFVVIEIGFTVAGQQDEAFEAFKVRMLNFTQALSMLGYPVVSLTFQRRRAQGKRYWAEFSCRTPETELPEAPARPGGLQD